MARLPFLTRSDTKQDPEPPPDRRDPAPPPDRRDPAPQRRRRRDTGFSEKIERAAEQAAAATRTAAATAAAERVRARPRTSTAAVFGLVLAVLAAAAVMTGALAGLGIAVGVVAVLVSFAGLVTTGHHYLYLAGRGVAALATLIGLASIVVGILALVGALPGLDTSTDQVARLQDWLPGWLS